MDIEYQLKTVLLHYYPNEIPISYLVEKTKLDLKQVNEVLETLGKNVSVKDGLVAWVGSNQLPIRRHIEVGNVKIPRIIRTDKIYPEQINIPIEKIAEIIAKEEALISKRVSDGLRKNWVSIINFMGLFIALFSIIISLTTKIDINPCWTYSEIFFKNLMQVLPISIIMMGFVLLIKILIR